MFEKGFNASVVFVEIEGQAYFFGGLVDVLTFDHARIEEVGCFSLHFYCYFLEDGLELLGVVREEGARGVGEEGTGEEFNGRFGKHFYRIKAIS